MIDTTASAPPVDLQYASKGITFESLQVLAFFSVGLLQTLLMYFVFSRSDDHYYFLDIANLGIQAIPTSGQELMDLKAELAGQAFYLLTSPARWLGGHELAHLLWLRLLTLWGFLAAFAAFTNMLAPDMDKADMRAARRVFMVLVLLYPGQLAWTSSLLRDGIATGVFLLGLYCLRPDWRVVFALPLFGAAFCMRPEYTLILALLLGALVAHRVVGHIRHRVVALGLVMLAFAIVTHSTQVKSAAFSQLAFGEDGRAYPLVAHAFDLGGYVRVLLQSILDPIPLDLPQAANAFGITDALFFIYLLWKSVPLLRQRDTRVAALTGAVIFGLWIYGYFEIWVGGFSRHRLCLEVALIALIALVACKKSTPGIGHEI